MNTDFLSHVKLAKLLLPEMIKRKSGHIINMSSIAGRTGIAQRTPYCAAKHAIIGYFDALRVEIHDQNVQITNVCPGPVRVSLFSRHRFFHFLLLLLLLQGRECKQLNPY
jgi:short-subunit dehydrogenase